MELVIYLDKEKRKNESLLLERVHSKEEIKKILDEKYGTWGWISYQILI